MKRLVTQFYEKEPQSSGFVSVIDSHGYRLVGVPREHIDVAIKNNKKEDLYGVYFLVNTNEAVNSVRYIYIGQTKQGPKRLLDHKKKKNQWNFAFMFLGDKNVMDLGTIDELEAHEINRYKKCPMFDVKQKANTASPTSYTLGIADVIEDVLSFFKYGISQTIEDSKFKPTADDPDSDEESNQADETVDSSANTDESPLKSYEPFFVRKKTAVLQPIKRKVFHLKANSVVSVRNSSKNPRYNEHQEDIQSGLLIPVSGDEYKLTADKPFTSPSGAADYVYGASKDGWNQSWKNDKGEKLDKYRAELK